MDSVEISYQEFENSSDKTIMIDGKLFYKIVSSCCFHITGRKQSVLSLVPSPDMPVSDKNLYQDEYGNHFTIDGFQFVLLYYNKIEKVASP